MSEERKPWKCRNGHELGSVRRNGHKITQLYLYRNAVDMSCNGDEVDVIAVIEGYVVDVRCSVPGCGAMRTWVPGEAALQKLINSYRKNHQIEEV